MNHYPRHIGDYLRDTSHLSLLEHGVYSRLLDIYYLNNGPLHADATAIARKVNARTRDEREAVERILAEFFSLEESGVFSHRRADREIEKFKVISETQRQRANKRYARPAAGLPGAVENLPGAASDMPAACQQPHASARMPDAASQAPHANHYPLPITHYPENTPPTPRKRGKVAKVDWFEGLPSELDFPEFREAWQDWVDYRQRCKKPVNPASLPRTWKSALANGAQKTIEDIDRAIINGWQGHNHKNKQQNQHDHRSEKRNREFPERIEVPDIISRGNRIARARGQSAENSGEGA